MFEALQGAASWYNAMLRCVTYRVERRFLSHAPLNHLEPELEHQGNIQVTTELAGFQTFEGPEAISKIQ